MKQDISNSWSWLTTTEELEKQVKQYNTLKITESYRGVAVLVVSVLLAFSLVLGYFEVVNLSSVLWNLTIYIPILFFVYRGHKWAIITLLLLWALEKVFTVIISVQNGNNPMSSVFWFLIVAPVIFKAYLVEREKDRSESTVELNQAADSLSCCASLEKKDMRAQLETEAGHSLEAKTKDSWTFLRVVKYLLMFIVVSGLLILKFTWGIVGLADNEASISNQDGLESLSSGDYAAATKQLESASDSASSVSTKMVTHSNLGYAYSSDGKYAEALSSFKEALVYAAPNSFNHYLISGEIALLEGNPKLALDYYIKAYDIDPDNFQINNALNLFYLDQNKTYPEYSNPQKALGYAIRAHDLSPEELRFIATENLGLAYFFNEDYRNALSYFTKTNIQQPSMRFWIGVSYFALQEYATAKPYLQRAYDGGISEANAFLVQY